MQRGITSLLILAGAAVVIGIIAVFFGFFITSKPASPNIKQTVELPPAYLIPPPAASSNARTDPNCPDTDYTGCDVSSQYMIFSEKDLIRTDSSKKPEEVNFQGTPLYK